MQVLLAISILAADVGGRVFPARDPQGSVTSVIQHMSGVAVVPKIAMGQQWRGQDLATVQDGDTCVDPDYEFPVPCEDDDD